MGYLEKKTAMRNISKVLKVSKSSEFRELYRANLPYLLWE